MNVLEVVVIAWLLVVAISWCLTEGIQMLVDRSEAKKKEKQTHQTLKFARANKHHQGSHRLKKV